MAETLSNGYATVCSNFVWIWETTYVFIRPCQRSIIKLFPKIAIGWQQLILSDPTQQNGQTQSNNSLATAKVHDRCSAGF